MQTDALIVVVDDILSCRDVVVRILQHGGFDPKPAADVDEAGEIFRKWAGSGPRLLILPATMVSSEEGRFEIPFRHAPRLKVLMTCTRPPECPLYPDVGCAELGCLQKPLDFTRDVLLDRVKSLLGVE